MDGITALPMERNYDEMNRSLRAPIRQMLTHTNASGQQTNYSKIKIRQTFYVFILYI